MFKSIQILLSEIKKDIPRSQNLWEEINDDDLEAFLNNFRIDPNTKKFLLDDVPRNQQFVAILDHLESPEELEKKIKIFFQNNFLDEI